MTVDTAAVRRRMGAIAIFRRATDDHATITRGASVVTEIVRETVPALCDALDEERERVRVLVNALEWYADERNYDEIGRPGNYVAGSTAGGFIQDPDWDTDDGWRAERALEAALATAGGEGATT